MTDQDMEMDMDATPPEQTNNRQLRNTVAVVNDITYATYLPRDIPYNESYENALQQTILEPPSSPTGHDYGIVVLSDTDAPDQLASHIISVRASDIQNTQLPLVAFDQLPLALEDPRRIYASPISGLRLTHPNGYLEGGPGFAPDDDTFAQDFIASHDITSSDQLKSTKADETKRLLDVVRDRMQARRDAALHNARIEKEIKTLTDQREMEVKIETKMRDDTRARRERREKRRERKSAG